MALLNAPCGCGAGGTTVLLYEDGTAPPVSGNRITIPNPVTQELWAAQTGRGIKVSQPLNDAHLGHRPTIEVSVSPQSAVKLGFDAAGRLTAGPVDVATLQSALLVNAGVALQGGLTVAQTGTRGHSVAVAVTPSAQSTGRVFIGADGGLAVDPPVPFVWEVINAGGSVRTLRLKNTLNGAIITVGTV